MLVRPDCSAGVIQGSLAGTMSASLAPDQGNTGGNTIYRLREGIERFLITDINNPGAGSHAQSDLAIMWDYLEGGTANASRIERFNHIPGGSNVMYADGHVDFVKYPNEKHLVTVVNGAFGKGW